MKILIASSICPEAITELKTGHDVVCAFGASEETLKQVISDREVLIFRSGVSITAAVMSAAPNLRLLIRAGSGMDNLDLPYANQRGFQIERIPEPGAKAVAEMSFALMLSLARNLLRADRLLRQGHWAKNELQGFLLTGKTLGIVGAGNIGGLVGEMGANWGMRVLGCVEHGTPDSTTRLGERGISATSFDEVIAQADFLSLHVPLTASTQGLIDASVFAKMKPGSFLINLARGGVVNEEDLMKAIAPGGRLNGAALDVHENEGQGKMSPLAGMPNVILTPHIGAQTIDSQREIGERILAALASFVPAKDINKQKAA